MDTLVAAYDAQECALNKNVLGQTKENIFLKEDQKKIIEK
jgi:hypothetical protein